MKGFSWPGALELSSSSSKLCSDGRMVWVSAGLFSTHILFLFTVILPGICSGDPFGNRNFGSGNQDAIEEHDLLQAIRVPFDDPRNQYFDSGLDGFPAFGIREGADIKAHYRLFLPDRLYRDFALLATVKPDRRDISYLFAVVNPLDTLVQFGLKISPSLTSSQNVISLLYTDHSSHLVTQTLTSFEVPLMTKKWNRFAMKVVGDTISLYLNCKLHSTQLVMRNPKELNFDSASTLYLGQAGPILKGNFQDLPPELNSIPIAFIIIILLPISFCFLGSRDTRTFSSKSLSRSPSSDFIQTQKGRGTVTNALALYTRQITSILARSKIWSVICVVGVGAALTLMIGGTLGWFESKDTTDLNPREESRKNFVLADAGFSSNVHQEGSTMKDEKNFSSGESSGDTDLNQLNDWSDITYDYPENDDYEDVELGSSAPIPPIPPPPPSPSGVDFTALRNLATSFKTTSKGDKGEPGPRGPEGPTGQKGEQGKGFTFLRESESGSGDEFIPFDPGSYSFGKCTCNYTELISKLPDSFRGIDGSPGSPGPPGTIGLKGEMGKKGEIGYQGPKGDQGSTGEKGERGLPGLSMTPNAVGFDPDWRPRNLMKEHLVPKPGPKGETGDAGPKGSTGSKGERGLQGSSGEKGDKGVAGVNGLPGPQGHKGDTGDVGPTGPIGPPGSPAPSNIVEIPEAIKGEKGEMGIRGRRGKPGPPGPPGEIGIPGWPPGMQPLGRPGATITGPKGDKGDSTGGTSEGFYKYEIQGPPAHCPTACPPGPPGAPGMPGISIVGEPGMGVPGPPGPKGSRGDFPSSASRVIPGAVVYSSRETMIQASESTLVGTIAFVREDENLFVRVSGGWRPIITGELIQGPSQNSGPFQIATPEPARLMRHPPPVSSLINSNPVEGPSLRLAALNEPWSGDIQGIRGADYACYRQARNANLVGTFRAFLVSYVQNLDSIVKYTDRNLPVLNTKGELLFNSWSDIFQGPGSFLSRPPSIFSFSGRNVMRDVHWAQKKIWHGSATGGLRTNTAYCEAWHSDSPSNMGLASDLLKSQILGQETIGCNSKLIVLCIEISSQANYRRRRRSVVGQDTPSSTTLHLSPNQIDSLFKNLTLDQYTRLIQGYDQELEDFEDDQILRENTSDD